MKLIFWCTVSLLSFAFFFLFKLQGSVWGNTKAMQHIQCLFLAWKYHCRVVIAVLYCTLPLYPSACPPCRFSLCYATVISCKTLQDLSYDCVTRGKQAVGPHRVQVAYQHIQQAFWILTFIVNGPCSCWQKDVVLQLNKFGFFKHYFYLFALIDSFELLFNWKM